MTYQEECQRIHDLYLQKIVREGTMPFSMRFYHNFTQTGAAIEIPGGLPDWVRQRMPVTSLFLRATGIEAAILSMDSMQLNTEKFAAHFHLSLDNIGTFQERYLHILEEQFDGTMKNLPRGLWQEAVWTCLKGPHIKCLPLVTPYTRNPGGTISLIQTAKCEQGELNILPDWWDTPVN